MATNDIDALEARVRADLAARDFAALAADASTLCAALSLRGGQSTELMAWGLEQAGKGYEGLLQYAQAEACYRQALAARRERGPLDAFALVVSLTHLARVCEEAGRYREASDIYEEAAIRRSPRRRRTWR